MRHLNSRLQYPLDDCREPRYTKFSTDSTTLQSVDMMARAEPAPAESIV